ncbi:MAG: purine-binding chemotaxis protein CheW [Clostridiales bacterium]|nr:purine-binding chemotaxis protein CheW [Clostridiales bacterium]
MEKELIIEEISEEEKYLLFAIGNDVYGLDIRYVEDIIGVQNITVVPKQPNYVKGVINLRGQIMPVIDIRIRFNQSERLYDDRTCIVVINVSDAAVGVVVDRVLEVVNIPEITVPPSFSDTNQNFMTGVGNYNDGVVLLVDCEALLEEITI